MSQGTMEHDVRLNISLEDAARLMAALSWTKSAFQATDEFHSQYHNAFVFLREYPDRDKYVDEWWEERYFPMLLEWLGDNLRRPDAAQIEQITASQYVPENAFGRRLRLHNLAVGMTVRTDDGFTCLEPGLQIVRKDPENGYYISCQDGRHYLDGQVDHDDPELLVGVYGFGR